ncbi:hypothetical protein MNEG_12115, partial [Monoraphidium neglectum]
CRQRGYPAVHHCEGVRLEHLLQHPDRRVRPRAAAAGPHGQPAQLRAAQGAAAAAQGAV